MLKALVEFSLRFRGIIVGLACFVLVYGLYVTEHAKLDVFPEFAPPQLVVQTEAAGFSSLQVEALVTRRVENALMGLNGLETIRSQSIQGLSVVTAVFREGTDLFRARQMVAERVGELTNQMPQGVSAPTVAPQTSGISVILSIGLRSAKLSPIELRTFADWTLRPLLLSVPGVAKIAVYGGDVAQLQVQVQPERLLAYGLGIDDVLRAAGAAAGVRATGFVENANQRVVLQAVGGSVTPQELGATVLKHRDGVSVRLADVAHVGWAGRAKIGDAAIFGEPGVVLTVSSQYRANTLAVTSTVDRALDELKPTFQAEGITVYPRLIRAASFIESAVDNARSALLWGAALVAIVLLLFLYNLPSAVISLSAIPLSMAMAVIALDRMGMSLNTITLGGLAIAIGEVVDDAIIDVENVVRRLRENRAGPAPRPVFDVIRDASLEVRSAVVYATFVVALVFFPALRMSGIQGSIFAPLGEAYILAVMASLAVALTLTPALCLALMPALGPSAEPALIRRLKSLHARWLRAAAARPQAVIVVVAAMCAGALALLPFFGGSFLPELRERSFILHMATTPGTSVEESLRVGGRIARALLEDPHVTGVSQRVGRAELGDDTYGPQISEMPIELKSFGTEDPEEVEARLRSTLAQFPGYQFSLESFLVEHIEELLSGQAAAVAVKIFGDNLDDLDRAAQRIAALLSRTRGAVDVRVQYPGGMPEMVVRLDPERVARFGFAPVDVLDAVETAYQGTVVAHTYQGNRSFEVSVILDPEDRHEPESVGALMLRNRRGAVFPLRELGSVFLGAGRYAIVHEGGRRIQIVTCNVSGRDVRSFAAEAQRTLGARAVLAPGVHAEFAGAAQARAQAERELLLNSLVAALAIVLLLYLAFGNLRNLMLVLLNVPFALVGGVIAVLLTGGYLSLGSIVGFVTLFGITARNSIMLVSHFDHLVSEEGMSWGVEAALRGASERLLPILMTALAAGLGLLPLALGSRTPGREIEGPMAMIILGGLVTSTVLNLLVLPTLALRYGRFQSGRE